MKEPLLSIVIPVYNAARFLPGCIESILAADLPDTEVLLIDDGSVDESLQVCRDYARRCAGIRVLHQENAGPSAARNRGIDESRGTYIAFLDADDELNAEALHRTVCLLSGSRAEMWISDFQRIAANGCVLDRVYQIDPTEQPITDPAYMLRFLSRGDQVWNVWRYVFLREFLLNNGLRFVQGINCAEDLEFVVRALTRVNSPVFYHNPYYAYRVFYGDTLTRQYTLRRLKDLMEMLLSAQRQVQQSQAQWADLLGDMLVREYLINLSLPLEVPPQDRQAALLECRRGRGLLRMARSRKMRLCSAVALMLGIRWAAVLVLALKSIKRRIRKYRIEGWDRKCG